MPKNIEKEPFKHYLTRILRLYWLFVCFFWLGVTISAVFFPLKPYEFLGAATKVMVDERLGGNIIGHSYNSCPA
jgi:hypothetical protein